MDNRPKSTRELIALPYMVFHETLHYVVARMLGMRAAWHWHHVTFWPKRQDWRVHVVVLSPAIAGLLAGGWAIGWVAVARDDWRRVAGIVLALIITAIWQLTCLSDWQDELYYYRHGHWRDGFFEVPETPTTLEDAIMNSESQE